jgi:hypothetical protein
VFAGFDARLQLTKPGANRGFGIDDGLGTPIDNHQSQIRQSPIRNRQS